MSNELAILREPEAMKRMGLTIYERYTDQVEGYGMDECWCDVSGRSPEKQDSSLRQTTAGQAKSVP